MTIYLIIIITIILILLLLPYNNENKSKNKSNINYNNYYKKDKIMTNTEIKFYNELIKVANSINLKVFPQVDLERIINVKDKNMSDRNRIKSRCIDFTIVDNNYNVICCIELDDYTHNRNDRIKRDIFINELFENVNLKLIRVKVGNYNFENITKEIKEAIN